MPSANLSKGNSDEVAKLKAELAAAEAKDKKDSAKTHKAHKVGRAVWEQGAVLRRDRDRKRNREWDRDRGWAGEGVV